MLLTSIHHTFCKRLRRSVYFGDEMPFKLLLEVRLYPIAGRISCDINVYVYKFALLI
jgi:hypothetical protein